MKKVKLLRIFDAGEAFPLMGEEAGLFGDNGGDPDGNAWLRPVDDFTPATVRRLVEAGVAEVVKGYAEPYPDHHWHTPPRGASEWCGFQDEEMVYFI